jgi:hypothetical protein
VNCCDPRYPRERRRCDGILFRASTEQLELLLVSRRGTTEAEAEDGNRTRRSLEVSHRTQGDAPNWSVCRSYGADIGGDEGEGRIDLELDIIVYFYGYQKRDGIISFCLV